MKVRRMGLLWSFQKSKTFQDRLEIAGRLTTEALSLLTSVRLPKVWSLLETPVSHPQTVTYMEETTVYQQVSPTISTTIPLELKALTITIKKVHQTNLLPVSSIPFLTLIL